MYVFRDTNSTVSEGIILPSEALMINGEFIESLIPGYRTLTVSGREALSPELTTYETGISDGSMLQNKRYPARIITVTYQLIAENSGAFREAYNRLGEILNVEDAELVFVDEPDKFFRGTPSAIGAVPPGRNAVTGEFEIFCADPFKYSVIEYEAEPIDGSFLIDYNGTYKSYPTLEAEFYNEDEGKKELEGYGDCGYVAFFNEEEKIIQLGNPEESDQETYAKSQTLVNQKFNYETAWGTIAQTNWAMNRGITSSSDVAQAGSVAVAVAHYENTISPSTSGTLLTKTSKEAKPYIDYKVTAKTSNRKADRIDVEVTIAASLSGTTNSGAVTVAAGAKVVLNNTKYYASSTTSSSSGTKTGTFYLWDASVVSGRVRITNSQSLVGKSGQITGWVNVSDLGMQNAASLGKDYGLKAFVRFGSGDWNYAVIKKESAVWTNNNTYTVKITTTVKNIDANTDVLEDIKFKVEHINKEDSKVGIVDETNCKDLEISTYNTPVAGSWYLMPQAYGTGSKWHGPSITRVLPADDSGAVGAKNFTFSYKQKMSIGSSSSATQEMGLFQVIVASGSGSNRKILAGVTVYKGSSGKTAKLRFYVNGKTVETMSIDLSLNNKYFGNNSTAKGITTVKTSTITKTGKKIEFNIGGIKKTFSNNAYKDIAATEITFTFGQYGTKPLLSYNGLYWAKFVKNNSDTWEDILNTFTSNDVVTVDCKNGEVYLNDSPTPSLGALGNDWEDFYLSPGLNQIGYSFSDWVYFEPSFKIRYREVFL